MFCFTTHFVHHHHQNHNHHHHHHRMSVDDDPPSGPAYPAFMGRVSDEHQRRVGGRKNNNGRKTKTKNDVMTRDDSKMDDDDAGNHHHRDDVNDDDESIDEENGDTKRDGESFDEEEDFWSTRKLVEQHRRDGCSVSSISKAIFKDIRLAKQGLSDAHLTQLEYVFGENNLGRALDVAASGGVTRFVGKKSRRIVYAVRATTTTSGSGKWTSLNNGGGMKGQQTPTQQHLTYPDHFCACKAFAWDVISRDEKLMCKHMLAAALAESVGGCDEVEMDDVVLANLLTKEMLE